jgi:phospholipid-binding protein, PBP family
MQLRSDSFQNGQRIPATCGFGKAADPFALSDNRSPHLAWKDAPHATRSFVLTCIDTDVPSRGDDVNQPGRTVPAELPRVEFVHWLMANIPAECAELGEGACSDEVTARGKRDPFGPPGSVQGLNDFTGWFAGDPTWPVTTSATMARARHGTTPCCTIITSRCTRSTWPACRSPRGFHAHNCRRRWPAMCWMRLNSSAPAA